MLLCCSADCGLGFSNASDLGLCPGCACRPGRKKPPHLQAFLLTEESGGGLLLAVGIAETRVFVALLSGEGGKAPSEAASGVRSACQGAYGYLGMENPRGGNHRQGNSANRGHRVHTFKYTAPRGPVSEKRIGRAESSVVFCADDSAGEIKVGAESGRSPPVLGLQLGREGQGLWVEHVAQGPGKVPPPQRSNMNSVLTKYGSPPRGWLSLRPGSGECVFFLFGPERRVDGSVRRGDFVDLGGAAW